MTNPYERGKIVAFIKAKADEEWLHNDTVHWALIAIADRIAAGDHMLLTKWQATQKK